MVKIKVPRDGSSNNQENIQDNMDKSQGVNSIVMEQTRKKW